MAIDPNVAQIRVPQLPSVTQTLADAMRLREGAEIAEARKKERDYRDQQRAKQEQEDMRVRLAFEGFRKADGSPDPTRIVNDVSTFAPERAMKLQQDFGTLQTHKTQQQLAEFNLQNERLDRAIQVLGSVDATKPTAALDYEVAIPYIKSRDPEMATFLGEKWDPATTPGKIKAAIASASTLTEQNRMKREAMTDVLNGNRDNALARWGAQVTNQQSLDDFIAFAQSIDVPEAQLRMLPREFDSVKTPEALKKLGMTPRESQMTDIQLKSAQTAADREARLLADAKKAGASGGGGGTPAIGAVGVRAANEALAAKVDEIDAQEEAGEISAEKAQQARDAAYQRYDERVKGKRPGPLAGAQVPVSDGSGTGHNPNAAADPAAATPAASLATARQQRDAALVTPPARVPVTRGGRTFYVPPESGAPGTTAAADVSTGNVHQQAPRGSSTQVPEGIKKALAAKGPGDHTIRSKSGKVSNWRKGTDGRITPLD